MESIELSAGRTGDRKSGFRRRRIYMNCEGTTLIQGVAEVMLMQFVVGKEESRWITTERWTEHVSKCYEKNGGKPPAEGWRNIVFKALFSLFLEGHARQLSRDYVSSEWKLLLQKSFYDMPVWKAFSLSFREYKGWRCEECGLLLRENRRRYLDTHHTYGLQRQDLEALQALCHGCHAEQRDGNHKEMKKKEKYKDFMKLYGKEWRERRSKSGFPS